jgi:L-alanine-DL-glutamate epimerase-like enolase superfamily enzyme
VAAIAVTTRAARAPSQWRRRVAGVGAGTVFADRTTLPHAAPFERLYLDLEASPYAPWTEASDGKLAVPQGPGLGCDPDQAVIAKYRTR